MKNNRTATKIVDQNGQTHDATPFPEFGMFMILRDGELLQCPMFDDGSPDTENLGEFEVICDHVTRAANAVFGTSFVPEDFGLDNESGAPCDCSHDTSAKWAAD